MGWCLGFVVLLSVSTSSATEHESAQMLDSIVQAQVDVGRILRGLGGGSDDGQGGRHQQGHIPQTMTPDHHDESEGDWRPTPKQPSYPTWPGRKPWPDRRPWPGRKPRPEYYPRPYYPSRPQYTPAPEYTPSSTVTPVPSNVLPTQPETTLEPETNVVQVNPEPNNFLDDLGFKPITPQQVDAFQKQLTQQNKKLGDDLKKMFPGNDKLIDQLVAAANKGQLDVQDVQRLVATLGGNLNLPGQLQATGFIRQLVFNNLAMAALFNVNINLLNIINININIVGINVGGGWGGFWGFPHWPWKHPIWLGPGMWWGPCGCAWPYYNPHLNGAAVMGVSYSNVAPVAGYQGNLVSSGILLTNIGGSKVNYTVSGKRYSLNPNYRQVIPRSQIMISFDRGGSFGNAKYGIDVGWYEFTPTKQGWELYENTAKITIDNTGNPFSFRYVLNNQQQALKPGYKQQHSSKYPLELKFDNGKGQITKKILGDGDFKVAVDTKGGLALFKPADVTTPAPIAQLSRKADSTTQNIFVRPEMIPNLFGDTTAGSTPASPSASGAPATPSLFGPKN